MRIEIQKSALDLPAWPGKAAWLLTIFRGHSGAAAHMKKRPGSADAMFDEYLAESSPRSQKEGFDDVLRQATPAFKSLIDPELPADLWWH